MSQRKLGKMIVVIVAALLVAAVRSATGHCSAAVLVVARRQISYCSDSVAAVAPVVVAVEADQTDLNRRFVAAAVEVGQRDSDLRAAVAAVLNQIGRWSVVRPSNRRD